MPVFRQASDAAQGDVKLEAITQPLYDQLGMVTGAGVYNFFQNPLGRAAQFTNVESAGSLTWPKRMSVKAFRLVPNPAGVATDVVSFYTNGSFRFRVGEKDYFVCPTFLLTPGVGLEVAILTGAVIPAAPANDVNYVHNGRPDHHNIYVLQHSIWLPSVQNFRATLEMAAGFTVAAGGAATLTVWTVLEGELFREIQ